MSYFEVYNEKIHDLLVFKAENRQKKQPVSCTQKQVYAQSQNSGICSVNKNTQMASDHCFVI